MNVNYVANGLGGQSMYLLYLASQKIIPATISITADTGWETDCDMMDGSKISAEDFYHRYVEPFGRRHGIGTSFVRTNDKSGNPLPSIPDYLADKIAKGRSNATPVPMFGSNNGRLKQSCTDKWKISAMKQECRRLGAITARSAQGIHYGERSRRVKGEYIGAEDGFSIYRSTKFNKKKNTFVPIKWLTHYYPLVDMQMTREDVGREMDRLGLPYLISSECGGCPHADPWRWLRRTPETIQAVAALESKYNGQMFFTDRRIPLLEAIAQMKEEAYMQPSLLDAADFGCKSEGWCGQ